MDIKKATQAYEAWLGSKMPLIDADLRLKHLRMAQSPFPFFRATFYRWVQLWPQVCPELAGAPPVLGVGDLHVENFGTWRDGEGRLIWGVNDFDEAALIPYANDLVRLAVSARLAMSESHLSCDPADAYDAILAGYREGIAAGGKPFILAEQHRWLRDVALSELRDPAAYWQRFNELPTLRAGIPAAVKADLNKALPEVRLPFRVIHRQAGLGSLGRRRFVALAELRGGWIAREAKELAVSAWHWEKNARAPAEIHYQRAVDQAVRVPDPFVGVSRQWLIRRLAPDCSRIELGTLPKMRDELKLLHAMGWETANIHLGTPAALRGVLKDLNQIR
jgi:uncharacterized protein (DUF2252 family)